jgi:hypothetical protein
VSATKSGQSGNFPRFGGWHRLALMLAGLLANLAIRSPQAARNQTKTASDIAARSIGNATTGETATSWPIVITFWLLVAVPLGWGTWQTLRGRRHFFGDGGAGSVGGSTAREDPPHACQGSDPEAGHGSTPLLAWVAGFLAPPSFAFLGVHAAATTAAAGWAASAAARGRWLPRSPLTASALSLRWPSPRLPSSPPRGFPFSVSSDPAPVDREPVFCSLEPASLCDLPCRDSRRGCANHPSPHGRPHAALALLIHLLPEAARGGSQGLALRAGLHAPESVARG